uniref:Uncharacterized protein n=1 Tax=Anguilla anguilla TaxID=7936 RepID=A0A0E9RQN5_ANGAN
MNKHFGVPVSSSQPTPANLCFDIALLQLTVSIQNCTNPPTHTP